MGAARATSQASKLAASVLYPAGCLQVRIAAAKDSLWAACQQSLAHGTLLTLRYLVLLVPWRDVMQSQGGAQPLRQWVGQLLDTLLVATDLVLPHLAQTGTLIGELWLAPSPDCAVGGLPCSAAACPLSPS